MCTSLFVLCGYGEKIAFESFFGSFALKVL
jgi:hypothetical protein